MMALVLYASDKFLSKLYERLENASVTFLGITLNKLNFVSERCFEIWSSVDSSSDERRIPGRLF
jgi:hypothetical protein